MKPNPLPPERKRPSAAAPLDLREKFIDGLVEDMQNLRIHATYSQFDVEATRRERDRAMMSLRRARNLLARQQQINATMAADMKRLVERKNSQFDEICALKDEIMRLRRGK